MKTKKIIIKNSKGQKLVGIIYNPESKNNAIAMFVHGYRSTKNSAKVKPVAEILAKENISLIAFDFTNNGESELKFENSTLSQHISDLNEMINYASQFTKNIGLIGNSLGGIITLQQAAKDNRIKVIVEQSPTSIFPWKNVDDLAPEKIKEWKEKGYVITKSARWGDLRINYTFYEDALQYNKLETYENINCPVLIVHGTEDKSVSYESAKNLIEHLKEGKLLTLKNADHNYTKKEDWNIMIEKTSKFLIENLK